MSVGERVTSDRQLARLLQIGVVLEELVEARAAHHHEALEASDPAVEALLEGAREESAKHRERLEELIEELDAESVALSEIETLVAERFETDAESFDDVLYDQLASEETAYKFYDDLIGAIENSDAAFTVGRDRLLAVLETLREEEAQGVEHVTEVMRDR